MKTNRNLFMSIYVIPMIAAMSFGLAACGGDDDEDSSKNIPVITELTENGYFDGILYYQITSNANSQKTAEAISAAKSCQVVIVPEKIKINDVVYLINQIGANAFSGCEQLISVQLPNSITSIGEKAFYKCSSLASINLPNSITCIRKETFYGCNNLQSITLPNNVTSIEDWAFAKCINISTITLPNSITSIGYGAFYGTGLQSITLPNGITSIKDWTFEDCRNLLQLTLPSSITSIGEFAFYDCHSLQSITLPCSITYIGDFAFRECKNLSKIYSHIENPENCQVNGGPFDYFYYTDDYYPTELVIPRGEGILEKYKSTYPWYLFYSITVGDY